MITRRTALAGLAAMAASAAARAEPAEELSVMSGGDSLSVSRHAAAAGGRRPGVIVLHGARGIELKPRAYERYATALSAKGIDSYFLRYLTAADTAAMTAKTSTRESRGAYDATRFDGWADAVSAAASMVLARPDSSGRIGLLGFSLGGFVAADAAARDARIAALAVLYAGMPDAMVAKVKHLPPLIALHGEADRNVPVAKGQELVALGKAVGVDAEFVSYPDRPHGFDFSDTDPMTSDAVDRISRFFQARLGD